MITDKGIKANDQDEHDDWWAWSLMSMMIDEHDYWVQREDWWAWLLSSQREDKFSVWKDLGKPTDHWKTNKPWKDQSWDIGTTSFFLRQTQSHNNDAHSYP